MFDLLKDTYKSMESIKGKKLIYTLIGVFIAFTIVGISIGYLMSFTLNRDEKDGVEEYLSNKSSDGSRAIEAEGRITYVNPEMYPLDDISFSLTDPSGKELYLLKSDDQKLRIAEGLTAKVKGELKKSSDGQRDILVVEEVVIKSAAD